MHNLNALSPYSFHPKHVNTLRLTNVDYRDPQLQVDEN